MFAILLHQDFEIITTHLTIFEIKLSFASYLCTYNFPIRLLLSLFFSLSLSPYYNLYERGTKRIIIFLGVFESALVEQSAKAPFACNARNFMHLRGSSSLDALNLEARRPCACTWPRLVHGSSINTCVCVTATYRVHREDSISVDPADSPTS